MLRWLKRKLRTWLLEDDRPPSDVLEVIVDGKIELVRAIRVAGTWIISESKHGQRLVGSWQCRDKGHFESLWNYLRPSGMAWEDGTQFNASDFS